MQPLMFWQLSVLVRSRVNSCSVNPFWRDENAAEPGTCPPYQDTARRRPGAPVVDASAAATASCGNATKSSPCPRSSDISIRSRSGSASTTVPTVPAGQRPESTSSSTTSRTASRGSVITTNSRRRSWDIYPGRGQARWFVSLHDPGRHDRRRSSIEALDLDDDLVGDSKAVQKLLGHSSIQTTGDVYADWDIAQLEAMAEVLADGS